MPYRSPAVVARAAGAPATLVELDVPDPGPGEAVVEVEASGVCRTDRHYRDGLVGADFPYLLGHEGAGTVVAVGPGVGPGGIGGIGPGDRVVLNWRAVCGRCRSCRRGEPRYCFDTRNADTPMTIADGPDAGRRVTAALGIGAFTRYTLVAAGQCTPVAPAVPATVAGLVGCGVMAGIGAVLHTGGARPGDSVAVIGAGTVGCAAVAGAKLAGATTIVAVSRSPERLAAARFFGATDTVCSAEDDVVAAVRAATGGFGADIVVDAAGLPQTWRAGFYARDLAGTLVLVGVPGPAARTPDIPLADVFARGGALKSSWYGDCLPGRDIPTLIDLYLGGRLPLDAFVTGATDLAGVDAALDAMEESHGLRTVVMTGAA